VSLLGRAVLLLDVLAQDGDGCTAHGAGEVGPGAQPELARQWWRASSGSSCRGLREDTPWRLFPGREMVMVGGKCTSRWR